MQTLTDEVAANSLETIKEEFSRTGYAVARGLFSPAEVKEIKEMFDVIADGGPLQGFGPVSEAEAGGDPLKRYPRFMQPHRVVPRAKDYLLHPGVIEILTALFEHEPLAVQSMYYWKPPGSRGQAMHQDNFYLLVEPYNCIAAWTAIDDVDPENGGMYLVPETHEYPIVCPDSADPKVSWSNHLVPTPAGKKAIPCRMKAGDTLFFNGNLLHGSGPNRSKDRFRRSYIGHYSSGVTDRISHYYMPMLTPDGTEVTVEANKSGGACGSEWAGATH
jgi:phytanoyl-CoA hydroxylase